MSNCEQKILVLASKEALETAVLEPDKLIKDIINQKKDSINTGRTSSAVLNPEYLWKIKNKYYETEVQFDIISMENFIAASDIEPFEAVLFIFHSGINSSDLLDADQWLFKTNKLKPSIRLAVCEKCGSEEDNTGFLTRKEITSWCLDHDFELVEICPDEEDYTEYEDFGVVRLRSALEAHIWPNIDIDNTHTGTSHGINGNAPQKNNKPLQSKEPTLDDSLEHELLDDCDDFDALFQKLKDFKLNSDALKSTSSRIDYAEKVVTAFLNAMGSEDDDI